MPKLRFPEFRGEWKENKFHKLYTIKNGLNKEKQFFGHGIKILNYMDVNKNVYNTEKTIEGLVDVNENEINRFDVSPNDLFFTRTSETSEEIGLTSAYTGKEIDCVFSGFILRARPLNNQINSLFYAYYFRNPKNRQTIIKHSSITTRALISGSNLGQMSIQVPLLKEQEKIAYFLSQVDRKIGLLETKQKLWETYKKGIIQQIFSQKIRFKDESGADYPDWGEKTLKKISDLNPKSTKLPEEFIYIDLESVESGILKKQVSIKREEAPSRAQRVLQKDDILFQTVRPYQRNNLFFNNTKSKKIHVASTGYAQLRTKEDPRFVYNILHTDDFVNKVIARCTGTSYPAINSKDLAKIKIIIPSILEQQKISKFISVIDSKINQLNRELEINKDYKKCLLQQMFC